MTITSAALKGAAALGMGRREIAAVIANLEQADFYKSMTSHHDHRIWQDVYHARTPEGVIYVKFTSGAVTGFVLLSFKER